jgi:hypothetical protein
LDDMTTAEKKIANELFAVDILIIKDHEYVLAS